jgi:HK97 family phage major capsid protein
VLFGKMNAYKVRRVRQLVILRLTERFAETRQEGFIAFERADGNLLNAGTMPIKYLQQKAA